jgi:hypothetical protein
MEEENRQETSQVHWIQFEPRNETSNPDWHNSSTKQSHVGRKAGMEKEQRKGRENISHLGVFGTSSDPFVPVLIFVLERRSTRGTLVIVRDEADDFGNEAGRSGGGGLKIKFLQSEFKHSCPVFKREGENWGEEEGQKRDENSRGT